MKRSTIITTIVIVLCIVAGGILGFYFYLNSKSAQLDTFGREVVTGSGFGNPSGTGSVSGNASTTLEDLPPIIQPTDVVPFGMPILRQIYGAPVAGMGFFTKDIYATTTPLTETIVVANGTTSATTTRVIRPEQRNLIARVETMQYMDRGNGHIYETASTTLNTLKISNTTYPKIYEALFPSKESVLMRDLAQDTDIIRTRYGILKSMSATSTSPELTIQQLAGNITSIALSPSKSKIFYAQKVTPSGVISNTDGTSQITAFDSPIKEWLVQWPTEKTLVITTKPSANVDGYAYKIDVASKNMQKLLGNIKGLTTLMSPSGEKLLYSESEQGSPNLYSLDIKTGQVTNLFLRTLPEKCVWSAKEKEMLYCAVPNELAITDYPDVWYQGRISFDDSIWRVNAQTAETRLFALIGSLADEPLDVINPMLNPSEDYLMFQNKIDLSLWGLRLANRTETPPTQ